MSCDNSVDMCILCYDKDVQDYDNSMNIIENNELIDYKHCLNIKVHPQCLCIWFIKQHNECLICRKKLDISHNVLNDANVFIVNIQKDDFSKIDIIYPYKHISIEYQRTNRSELPPLNIDNINIELSNVINVMNIGDVDIDNATRINVIRFLPIADSIKILLYLFILYTFGFFVNIIYKFIFPEKSEIF